MLCIERSAPNRFAPRFPVGRPCHEYYDAGGLIRTIHRPTNTATLLRGHASEIVDMQFLVTGGGTGAADLLGTIAEGGNVLVWRLAPPEGNDIRFHTTLNPQLIQLTRFLFPPAHQDTTDSSLIYVLPALQPLSFPEILKR